MADTDLHSKTHPHLPGMNSLSVSEASEQTASEAMTIPQASLWASQKTGQTVTPSNISYLIKYDRIPHQKENGATTVSIYDLEKYYSGRLGSRELAYKKRLGDDINWHLSFDQYKEAETTKHVHRIHPYKGKFIPQLVEYFLDSHTDEYKEIACFAEGDIVLDPFCGSGTTLVQSNELGLHAVGIDISMFNSMISNLKLKEYDISQLSTAVTKIEKSIEANSAGILARQFEISLLAELKKYNSIYFPAPEFRKRLRLGEIDEKPYAESCQQEFLEEFYSLLDQYSVSNEINSDTGGFINNWYLEPVKSEIDSALQEIDKITDVGLRDILRLILSRTARSARATTHFDLATLITPVNETYYCPKHSKICKPLFSMLGWWKRYAKDTIQRLNEFGEIRTQTKQLCLTGDSRTIDIFSAVQEEGKEFGETVKNNKIRGIFTSPPYVGVIDYHEQHAYAYEMFNFPRKDNLEIGPMSAGNNKAAQSAYIEGISDVLLNCQQYLVEDFDIFIVANDKNELYPEIAKKSGLMICQEYKRPVLNRAEGNKGKYGESIFHMKRSDK